MNIPCPNKSICVDDANALGNYSSEEPDRNLFRSTHYPNGIWEDDPDIWMACLGLCVSEVSQADADLCAHNNAKICEGSKLFGNAVHTCTRTCADGQEYSMTVPANTFYAETQAQANALAVDWCNDYLDQLCAHIADPTVPAPIYRFPVPRPGEACNDPLALDTVCVDGGRGTIIPACFVVGANKAAANSQARSAGEQLITNNIGCLVEFPKSFCINESITRFIVPDRTGMFYPPLSWEVFGSVSPGITFEPMGIAMKISGSFTESGLFVFRLTLTDSRGTYTYRTYRVEVMEIDEPNILPDGQEDAAYSHTISVQHGWDPKTFSVKSGDVLPTGLSLNGTTGEIFGTPTTYGTYTFSIVVVDKYFASCEKEFTLTIDPNIFSSITWNTLWQPDGNGTGQATAAGGQVLLEAIDPGGPIGSGGTARADCVWNCWNPTADPIICSILITQTRLNPCPPEAEGVQWGAIGLYYWARNDIPIIIANSAGLVPIGVHGPFFFTIPPGASQWVGNFITYCGSQGSVPFKGGNAILTAQLSII